MSADSLTSSKESGNFSEVGDNFFPLKSKSKVQVTTFYASRERIDLQRQAREPGRQPQVGGVGNPCVLLTMNKRLEPSLQAAQSLRRRVASRGTSLSRTMD